MSSKLPCTHHHELHANLEPFAFSIPSSTKVPQLSILRLKRPQTPFMPRSALACACALGSTASARSVPVARPRAAPASTARCLAASKPLREPMFKVRMGVSARSCGCTACLRSVLVLRGREVSEVSEERRGWSFLAERGKRAMSGGGSAASGSPWYPREMSTLKSGVRSRPADERDEMSSKAVTRLWTGDAVSRLLWFSVALVP